MKTTIRYLGRQCGRIIRFVIGGVRCLLESFGIGKRDSHIICLYRDNVIGCIKKYKDLKNARNYLSRGRKDLLSSEFAEVIDSVHKWLLGNLLDSPVRANNVLGLLAEFDTAGDKKRRGRFELIEALHKKRKEQENKAKLERAAQVNRMEEAKRREQAKKKRRILLGEGLSKDFLRTDKIFFHSLVHDGILSKDEFEGQKLEVVRKWLADRSEKFGVAIPIDEEQLAAVAAVNGHVKVVARAGSGKTTTLVHRALFLMEHCNVPASSLLLLAFNNKAALEMRRRLLGLMHSEADVQYEIEKGKNKGQRVGIDKIDLEKETINAVAEHLGIVLPHVMTFHALANRIVRPNEKIIYDDNNGSKALSSEFQRVIKDRCKDTQYEAKVRKLMLEHFKENWDHIFNIKFRRTSQNVSLKNEYVKSHGEKLIANFLFEHDIEYGYEHTVFWDGKPYKPDFRIKNKQGGNGGVIVEYFGLSGKTNYDKMSQRKREYWKKKRGWELIELVPSDISSNGEENFNELLKSKLEELGVICNRLSEDEIWDRIKDKIISKFARTMGGFIGRCRKLVLSPDDLKHRIDSHDPLAKVELNFSRIAHKIYAEYLEWLPKNGKDDFDGLMQRAVSEIEGGHTIFESRNDGGDLGHLRYIFVDEFQDFSYLFYKLLDAIKKVNQSVEFFCVGDDWQAINGFAGSDLKYFQHFDEFIGKHRCLYITTNYRSAKSIVDVGNALMYGRGGPAVANKKTLGEVLVADASKFKHTPIEKKYHTYDTITPMVSRIVNVSLKSGSDVVMLSRTNGLQWEVNYGNQKYSDNNKLTKFLNHIRSLLPEESRNNISISTAHKYKGLEKPTVIVLDAFDGCYPLIHQDWIFTRVLGDDLNSIIAEERRLLYVALTRAVEKLIIITDHGKHPQFLNELKAVRSLTPINWRNYPQVPSLSSKLIVKVGNQKGRGSNNTYDIKEILKQYRYKWYPEDWPSWAKILAKEFDIDQLRAEPWVTQADGIEVRICDEVDNVTERYLIDNGVLKKQL